MNHLDVYGGLMATLTHGGHLKTAGHFKSLLSVCNSCDATSSSGFTDGKVCYLQ